MYGWEYWCKPMKYLQYGPSPVFESVLLCTSNALDHPICLLLKHYSFFSVCLLVICSLLFCYIEGKQRVLPAEVWESKHVKYAVERTKRKGVSRNFRPQIRTMLDCWCWWFVTSLSPVFAFKTVATWRDVKVEREGIRTTNKRRTPCESMKN